MTKGHTREMVGLAGVAALVPLIGWAYWALVLRLGGNDFHDYWLAGRLLLQGHSPYDTQAIANLAASERLTFLVGGGYSYPLPFAVAMIPLALLPFGLAITVFSVASLVAFGLTVAAGIGWAFGWAPGLARRRLVVALAAGLYVPVYGSIAMGQANLILFPLLGGGAVLAIDGATPARRWLGGALLGLAAIVKLVPAAMAVPLALGRRFGAVVGLAAAALGALGAATIALPWAAAGSGGLAYLFDPDAYVTNQSINGFVTRLVAPPGPTAPAAVPLWENGFDPRPVMLGLTVAFGLATLAVLWRARVKLRTRRGAALGLGLALVAGVIGAPKTSFWNESIVLIAVGLLLAMETPDLRIGRLGRLDRALLAFWFGATIVWSAVWGTSPQITVPFATLVMLLWSSSLYGMLALWLLFVRRLLAAQTGAIPAGATQAGAIPAASSATIS